MNQTDTKQIKRKFKFRSLSHLSSFIKKSKNNDDNKSNNYNNKFDRDIISNKQFELLIVIAKQSSLSYMLLCVIVALMCLPLCAVSRCIQSCTVLFRWAQ